MCRHMRFKIITSLLLLAVPVTVCGSVRTHVCEMHEHGHNAPRSGRLGLAGTWVLGGDRLRLCSLGTGSGGVCVEVWCMQHGRWGRWHVERRSRCALWYVDGSRAREIQHDVLLMCYSRSVITLRIWAPYCVHVAMYAGGRCYTIRQTADWVIRDSAWQMTYVTHCARCGG